MSSSLKKPKISITALKEVRANSLNDHSFRCSNVSARVPDLHDIIFRRARQRPPRIQIPAHVSNNVRMPAMHKHEFRRTIFSVFGRLFQADASHVPEVDATI